MLPIWTHKFPFQNLKTHDTQVYDNVSEVVSYQSFLPKMWTHFPYLPCSALSFTDRIFFIVLILCVNIP
jgi:hypothetical protein